MQMTIINPSSKMYTIEEDNKKAKEENFLSQGIDAGKRNEEEEEIEQQQDDDRIIRRATTIAKKKQGNSCQKYCCVRPAKSDSFLSKV